MAESVQSSTKEKIQELKSKLRKNPHVLDTSEEYSFVPKIHHHRDMAKWFCRAVLYLSRHETSKLREYVGGLRKAIYDTVQEYNEVAHTTPPDLESELEKVVSKMTQIMKFRVVSYARTIHQVYKYVHHVIKRARAISKVIHSQGHKLRKVVGQRVAELRRNKQTLVNSAQSTHVEVEDPEFSGAFELTSVSQDAQLKVMKDKIRDIYQSLKQSRKQRMAALLQHDTTKVQAIDAQIRKFETQAGALTMARQYLQSIEPMVSIVAPKHAMDSTDDAIHRMVRAMNNHKTSDHELYNDHLENMLDEHSTGMSLFLGLKTEQEVKKLQQDMVETVCKNTGNIFGHGRREMLALNQQLAMLHSRLVQLDHDHHASNWIHVVARKYRASMAKVSTELLGMFKIPILVPEKNSPGK